MEPQAFEDEVYLQEVQFEKNEFDERVLFLYNKDSKVAKVPKGLFIDSKI